MSKDNQEFRNYFLFSTPTKVGGREKRATVCANTDGNNIMYGVAICCDNDNFRRDVGRNIAEARMNDGFGKVEIKGSMSDSPEYITKFMADIAQSIIDHPRRWEDKVASYAQEHANDRKRTDSMQKIELKS